jgi:hypothetical protein
MSTHPEPLGPLQHQETLNITSLTDISRGVAAEIDPRLRVIGVASTDGDSGRAELFVTIEGCHDDPCVVMVNVTRVGHTAFERDVRERFEAALAAHRRSEISASHQ